MSIDTAVPATIQDPVKEIEAMKQISVLFSNLTPEAIARVLAWAKGYYKLETTNTSAEIPDPANQNQKFETFPDLYGATNPSNDTDKALIAAYYLQIIQAQNELDGFSINSLLKDMGHPLSNVTNSLSGLMTRKPALILQTKKSGSSQQARKKYKLTYEGKRAVEQMIRGSGE